jgi:hypothetical protein
MKKLFLSAIILFISFISNAQTLVPNGDFENWSTGSCGDSLSEYVSFAASFHYDYGSCPTASGITKSTNKYSGTYALQLTAVNSIVSASNMIYLSSTIDGQGVHFNDRPTKLVGYAKFNLEATDTLSIIVEIADSSAGLIAVGDIAFFSTQSDYTKFEIPLFYNQLNTKKPTILSIMLTLGDNHGNASPNSIALIDAFTFEYGTTTATTNYTSTSPINVYAAKKISTSLTMFQMYALLI